jgi:energy-coupling factor transporter ATP-binding protein EcfA2
MKLESCRLTNFSVIRSAEFQFSPEINVFIGRNGAGKSHLMKLLYSLLRARRDFVDAPSTDAFAAGIKTKLAGVFRPDEDAVGRLVSRGTGRNKATVHLYAGAGAGDKTGLKLSWSTLSNLSVQENTFPRTAPSVFLPSREALAMYEGFVQAYEERELSFDETYRDLCVQLSGSQLRGPRLDAVRKLASPLEKELGGAIRLDGKRFYRVAPGGNLEAHLLSEGLRKIGVLTHLVLNGSIIKNGFLFWDEPEANLNPRLVTVIAKTLRMLAGFGIQIFVATHDYLLLNELALADEYRSVLPEGEPRVDVKFFGLALSEDMSHANVSSADRLRDLQVNDILQEFAAYYDRRASLIDKSLS